jgi:hypothetical protein
MSAIGAVVDGKQERPTSAPLRAGTKNARRLRERADKTTTNRGYAQDEQGMKPLHLLQFRVQMAPIGGGGDSERTLLFWCR